MDGRKRRNELPFASRPKYVLLLAVAVLLPTFDEPQPVLLAALNRYSTLDSFSATLVHQDSSGLFPGTYTQDLKWKKGVKFELLVTKPNKVKLSPDSQGGLAPNYYSNGTDVIALWQGRAQSVSPVKIPDNTSPGWEVSGGPIMAFLINSHTAKFYSSPPEGVNMAYSWGPRMKWRGEEVREIKIEMTQGTLTLPLFMFVSKDGKEFVGYEWEAQKKIGFLHYTSRKENPTLPETLGNPPKSLKQ